MIILDATTKILEVLSTAAVSLDYYVSYVDITTSAFTPGVSDGNISTATTTTILAAPASSTQRQVKHISLTNRSTTTAQGVTVKYDVSGVERYLTPSITLNPGESYQYSSDTGWQVFDKNGAAKAATIQNSGITGRAVPFYKSGTAPEAAGNTYSHLKDAGYPGAFTVGTPGLSGRTTDGTTTTDAGCIPFTNASSGSIYLTDLNITSTVAGFYGFYDLLWINSGIVVTTTTAQTINSVTFPARDINGSTDGEGVQIGLLVTTATTNAALNSTMTVSYTNSNNVSGRTATVGTGVDSYPATAVIGTLVPFRLQAGDTGVRSIQSITLATTLTAGAVSLIAFRPIIYKSVSLANTGTMQVVIPEPGILLYSGTCLIPVNIASATTAQIISGTLTFMEK
ncbi:MAG: hypothetical protein C0446_08385 [Chitinophaga sp.]|nr:hypothetical protein [Chitinophaga sp.]